MNFAAAVYIIAHILKQLQYLSKEPEINDGASMKWILLNNTKDHTTDTHNIGEP